MPPFGPVSRKDLIAGFRALGFDGPRRGGKHDYMERGNTKVRLPNPHAGDVSTGLLSRLLRQAGISKSDWESI